MAGIPNKIFEIEKNSQLSWQYEWVVASGAAATIARGTPAKRTDIDAATATGAVLPMVDGNGGNTGNTMAGSGTFAGIAKANSTDTASAAGTVELWAPVPGLIYRGFAKSATAANTQALINVLMGKRVVFDLTSSDWTVDSAAADAAVNNVIIVGGNPNENSLLFAYADKGSVFGTTNTITS